MLLWVCKTVSKSLPNSTFMQYKRNQNHYNMKKVILLTFILLIVNFTIFGQNFIHSGNGQLYRGNNPIQLKGVNFWAYDDEYPNTEFPYVYNWYANEFNEASFSEIVESFCFNIVRLNLDFRFFENDNNPNVYLQAGWDWLDEKILWAKNNNVYLILDMHAPQGGYQSYGFQGAFWGNTSQSISNRTRFKNLWKEIANHYKNDTIIAGFDLINEPLPPNNSSYWTLIQQTVAEIRTVDNNHLIIIEEAFNANFQWQTITDNNYSIDFHFYNPWEFVANGNTLPYNYTYAQLEADLLAQGLQFALNNGIPVNIGEYGIQRDVLERPGSNWQQNLNDLHTLYNTYNLSHQLWNYHAGYWGLHEPYGGTLPGTGDINTTLYSYYSNLCNATSVKDYDSYEKNLIYPNPSQDYVYIKLEETINEIEIYNPIGQLLNRISSPKQNKIYISNIPAGIYSVVIKTDKNIYTSKMIKK